MRGRAEIIHHHLASKILRLASSRPLSFYDGEELRPCPGVLAEDPARGGGDDFAAGFLDPAHRGAQVFRLDHPGGTRRTQSTLTEKVRTPRCHALLHLA